MWRRRFLTPLRNVTVIKSLLLPKLTHLLIALPNHDTQTLNNINGIFFDFLWNDRAKIKQPVVVKKYFEGGLKMMPFDGLCSGSKNHMVTTDSSK